MKVHLSIILTLIFVGAVIAQQPAEERSQGIAFYQKENFSAAANSLQRAVKRNQSDAEAWHYLGWALLKTGNFKDSVEAFKTAAKLKPLDAGPFVGMAYAALSAGKPDDAQARAEKAITLDPKGIQAYYVLIAAYWQRGSFKSARETADRALAVNADLPDLYQAKVSALFYEAVKENDTGTLSDNRRARLFSETKSALESYPHLSANTPNAQVMKNKLADLALFQQGVEERLKALTLGAVQVVRDAPGDPSALKIISKIPASYTDAARQNQEQGIVTLAVLFSADGTVPYALPLTGLRYKLTRQAVAAATQGITFKPALSNGKPVSTIKWIEYSFSIY